MNKILEQDSSIESIEMAEVVEFDDIDDDIREWLLTPPVQSKDYGFSEPESEEEYYSMLDELSELLMER